MQENALGVSNFTSGRTGNVSGTVIIAGNQVAGATFRIDLTNIKVGGKTQQQLTKSLNNPAQPIATLVLTQPVTLTDPLRISAASRDVQHLRMPVPGHDDCLSAQIATQPVRSEPSYR